MTSTPRVCRACGQTILNAEDQVRAAIRGALDVAGITQTELARRIGMSQKHVSQVLTGKTGLSLALADRMLAAIGSRLRMTVEAR